MAMPAPTFNDSADNDGAPVPFFPAPKNDEEFAYMMTKEALEELAGISPAVLQRIDELILSGGIQPYASADELEEEEGAPPRRASLGERLTRTKGAFTPAHKFALQTTCRMQRRLPNPANELQKLNVTTLGYRIGCNAKTAGRYIDDLAYWDLLDKKLVPAAAGSYPEVWVAPIRMPDYGEEFPRPPSKVHDAKRKPCWHCGSLERVVRTTVICAGCGAVLDKHEHRFSAGEGTPDSGLLPNEEAGTDKSSLPSMQESTVDSGLPSTIKEAARADSKLPDDAPPGRYVVNGHVIYRIWPRVLGQEEGPDEVPETLHPPFTEEDAAAYLEQMAAIESLPDPARCEHAWVKDPTYGWCCGRCGEKAQDIFRQRALQLLRKEA